MKNTILLKINQNSEKYNKSYKAVQKGVKGEQKYIIRRRKKKE